MVKGAGMMWGKTICVLFFAAACVFSQTKDSYNQETPKGGLLDPSRIKINHSLSFGMGAAQGMSMQSQGMYSTLLTYQFSRPVTLHLNFGLPLFSTFSPYGNLNQQNISSMAYFKNMPIDVSLSWKPAENLFLQLNVVRNPQYDYYSGYANPFYSRHLFPY
jgi:hypothetical protein